MDHGIGEQFFRETRHRRGHLVGGRMDWSRQPEWSTTYPGAPQIPLPPLEAEHESDLFEVMARRRSVRSYGGEPVTLAELSRLLWAAAGITSDARAARPSARPPRRGRSTPSRPT